MYKITIFGTSNRIDEIENRNDTQIILRTKTCDASSILQSNGVTFITLDDVYQKAQDFDALDKLLADEVISHAKDSDVYYIVAGSAISGDGSVNEIFRSCPNVEIISGDAPEYDLLAKNPYADASGGYCVIPAACLEGGMFSPRLPLIVTALDNAYLLSDVKILLSEEYGDDHEIIIGNHDSYSKMMLHQMDRHQNPNHNTMVYIPPRTDDARYDLYELQNVFTALRSPQGCPWDREQTHASLKRYLLEECAEVIEAINGGNMHELMDELGDVLLQVLFHATIASERGDFEMRDVIDNLARKIIKRHPHVFSYANAENPDEVKVIWDRIKGEDKDDKSYTAKLREVPKSMTALMRAQKVLSRASKAPFFAGNMQDIEKILAKLEAEISSLKQASIQGNEPQIEISIGKMLFAISNISRLLGHESEILLNDQTNNYIEQFKQLERKN